MAVMVAWKLFTRNGDGAGMVGGGRGHNGGGVKCLRPLYIVGRRC